MKNKNDLPTMTINVTKLITDEDIENHQDFFVKCAKDYRDLATKLINDFADSYGLIINPQSPISTLCHTNNLGYEPEGKFKDWEYFFHGLHCRFVNINTAQCVEVPLIRGLEFGQLDPCFFVGFIKSTEEYRPLPVEMNSDYEDGKQVLSKMIELGRFEYIVSNGKRTNSVLVVEG